MNLLTMILSVLLGVLVIYSGWFILDVWGMLNPASKIMWFIFSFAWFFRFVWVSIEQEDK